MRYDKLKASLRALGRTITIDVNEGAGRLFFGYFLSKKKVPAGVQGRHKPRNTIYPPHPNPLPRRGEGIKF